MSNRGTTTTFDDTGNTRTAVLKKSEMVIDTAPGGDGRLRVGDGVTPGGREHVTRFPSAPASTVVSDYDDLYPGFTQRFYDTANNRLYPLRGLGPDNAACPDISLPDSNGNKMSAWMWAIEQRALVERARKTQTATAIARVQNSWNYFKTQFSTVQMTSAVYGANQVLGLADDAAWIANSFMDTWDITGDATALRAAIEVFAATYVMFQDTRSQNPIISYTAKTPAGVTLQRNIYGYLYDQSRGLNDGSSCHEVMVAICGGRIAALPDATIAGLYASNGTTSAQALKAALSALFADTFTWYMAYLRWAGSATAVAGLCGSLLILNPSASDFHKLENISIRGTTKRAATAFADHGTVAAIVMSDMLYQSTNDVKYLTEMQSALVAYPTDTTGFGRRLRGLPCLVNSQDPWTDGYWHAEATRRVLARYPDPAAYSDYKLHILGAAKVIAARSGNGRISPDWGPAELSGGAGCYFWPQDSANVSGGGGQADGRHGTAASSSMLVLAAGAMLAATEAVMGSGMNAASVEITSGQAAAAAGGLDVTRFSPYLNFGRGEWRSITADGTFRAYIDEVVRVTIGLNGIDFWQGASSHGDHYFFGGGIMVNQGMQFLASKYGYQLYIGEPGGSPGINLGVQNSYINANGTSINLVAAGTQTVRFMPGKTSVYGQVSANTAELSSLSTYADNASAKAGGLAVNAVYKTSSGQLMIVT